MARVLIVSWEYPPVVAGGLGRHVRGLAEALVALGEEVHVLTRGRDGIAPEAAPGGVRVVRVAEPDFPRADLPAFLRWVDGMNRHLRDAGRALAGRTPFDVVHSHDWLVAGAARHLARALARPWVVTVHATEHGRHQGWVQRHPQSRIHAVERRMVARADRVVVCSEFMRGELRDAFGADDARVAVVPNGIAAGPVASVGDLPRLRARFAAPDERLVLLAGRLVHEKGFHLALEALERLPGVRFAVAGTGPAEADLRAQAVRPGLAGRGTFLGWLGDDELPGLYRVADACVVPSLYEPFGLVALEAMAAGCPCVVADTGGLREVVPPGSRVGLRFRAGDAASLERALRGLLADPALRARLAAGGAAHVRRFTWPDVARRTAAVYATAMAPPPDRIA